MGGGGVYGGWATQVAGVFAGGADLAEGGWGVTMDEAEWAVTRCRLVRPYDALHGRERRLVGIS